MARYKVDRQRYSESYIERKSCEYAESLGWYQRKFTSPGRRGVPDRLFAKAGIIVFVEFKAPDKRPTRQQYREINELKAVGMRTYWCDGIAKFMAIFDSLELEFAEQFAQFKENTDVDDLI